VTTSPFVSNSYKIIDNNQSTYTEFDLDKNDQGIVKISLESSVPVTSSAMVVLLDKNIALPTSVDISAAVDNVSKRVLAKSKMSQQTIRFPKTTAKEWEITFTYAQPLRINELRLIQENADVDTDQSLRFLAQPGRNYRIYFNPDRFVTTKTSEAGNLYANEDVLLLNSVASLSNPDYVQSDLDKDGIVDIYDNCVSISNPDQEDINGNGRGDVCDDFDKDGIINAKDNCINNPNKNQIDSDGDNIGDACDVEESRITEKYKWIPWLGIVFALGVIISLFIITARSKEKPIEREEEEVDDRHLE